MSSVELAFDIWALIIDILGDEFSPDTDSLRTLSLSCKTILPLCRRHLFSAVTLIDDKQVPTTIVRFHTLISNNPSIIQYVRHLRHNIRFPDDIRVHQIFDILGSSALQSVYLWSPGIGWDTFPMSFQIVLERLIQLPSVTKLDLSCIKSVPSSVLLGCQHLQHLILRNVGFSISKLMDLPVAKLQLRYLSAEEDCFNGLQSLMDHYGQSVEAAIVDFSFLREIELSLESAGGMRFMLKMLEVSTNLESLNLRSDGPISWAGLGFALSTWTIRTLKKLTVTMFVTSEDYNPLCGLVDELSMIAGLNVIESISLDVSFDTDVNCRAGTKDWTLFDTLVTTPGSFPMLKAVSVDILWFVFGTRKQQALDRITEKDFPTLLDSNDINFRYSVTGYDV